MNSNKPAEKPYFLHNLVMVGHWCEGRGKRHNSFPTAYLARFVFPFAPNGSRTRKLRKHPIFFTSNMVRIKGLNLFSLSFPYTTNSWPLQGTLLSWCHLFPILCTPLEQQVPVMFLLWFSLLPTQNREKNSLILVFSTPGGTSVSLPCHEGCDS